MARVKKSNKKIKKILIWRDGVLEYWSTAPFLPAPEFFRKDLLGIVLEYCIFRFSHSSLAQTRLLGEAPYLFLRYSKNFLCSGNPVEHLQGTILTKGDHSLVNSFFLYGIGIRGL